MEQTTVHVVPKIVIVKNVKPPTNDLKQTSSQEKTPLAKKSFINHFYLRGIYMEKLDIVKKTLRNHLIYTLSPEFYKETLCEYSQIFSGEDMESIKAMVIEDINRQVDELKKQISSI